ncbi:hypothetical protein CD790_25615 [Streptomyces sp. SAJ15]|nr:hypothetical protein CD790_25615 [Streptomyces sp. SAJ15]
MSSWLTRAPEPMRSAVGVRPGTSRAGRVVDEPEPQHDWARDQNPDEMPPLPRRDPGGSL